MRDNNLAKQISGGVKTYFISSFLVSIYSIPSLICIHVCALNVKINGENMKKNKTQPQSTRLTKTNKKRFYSLMLDFLGYIEEGYSAEYSEIKTNYWRVTKSLEEWGGKWMLSQKRKDIIFLLSLDKLNSLSQWHNGYRYHNPTDIKVAREKFGGFDKIAKKVKASIKKNKLPRLSDSLIDFLIPNSENYLDKQKIFSSENLLRLTINGSISYACRFTLNKYISLVVKRGKGMALKKAIDCTQITSTTKYNSLFYERAKETADPRLFRLLCNNLSYTKKGELFLHIYNDTIKKYNKKPYSLSETATWWRSDLFPQKLFNVYFNMSQASGYRNCTESKRKALSVISKELGECLFSMDWNNNKFLLLSKLPYDTLYNIMFSYISAQPKDKVKDLLHNFYSNILAKHNELFIPDILNQPSILEKNQINFIQTFLEKESNYTRNISSDILRDCIALYGKDEDFLFFMSHLKTDHKAEFFERAKSKWK